jgi:hypothetical protein
LWPPKKGDSIKRKDLMGIDEEENYCYLAYWNFYGSFFIWLDIINGQK